MFLRELFPAEYVKIGLEAEGKDDVFEELVDYFCQASGLTSRDEILKALREREEKMSTGIQKGIAIPHGKTGAVNTMKGVVGISHKGVDYDALDGEPVYLFFLILAPLEDSEKHLLVLRRLADILEKPQFFSELQAQKNAQDVCKIISKFEEGLIAEAV